MGQKAQEEVERRVEQKKQGGGGKRGINEKKGSKRQ